MTTTIGDQIRQLPCWAPDVDMCLQMAHKQGLEDAAVFVEKRASSLIGDGEFLAWDNSSPPQLWVWAGERDESAEPVRRLDIPPTPELERLREENERLHDRLSAIMGELSNDEPRQVAEHAARFKEGVDPQIVIRDAIAEYKAHFNLSCEFREQDQRKLCDVEADLELKTKQLHRIRDILSFSTGNNGDKIEAIGKVVPAILCGEPDLSPGELFGATCNRVARDIPEGWIVTIELSRNSGTIGLTDPFGYEVEFPSNRENFGDQLNDALEYALDNDIKYADEDEESE